MIRSGGSFLLAPFTADCSARRIAWSGRHRRPGRLVPRAASEDRDGGTGATSRPLGGRAPACPHPGSRPRAGPKTVVPVHIPLLLAERAADRSASPPGAGTPPGGSQGRCTLQPLTLTRGSTSPPEAGLLTPGSTLPRAFPGPMSQWRRSGSLPGHSGATVPDSHRLPFSAPGSTSPAATSGATQIVQRRHSARRPRLPQPPQDVPLAAPGAVRPRRTAAPGRRVGKG